MSNYRRHWDSMNATAPSRFVWMAGQPVVVARQVKQFTYYTRDHKTITYQFHKPGQPTRKHTVREGSPSHTRIMRTQGVTQ